MAWRAMHVRGLISLRSACDGTQEPRGHSKLSSFQGTLEAWVLASYAAVSRSFPLDALFGLETLNGRLAR